MKSLRLVAIAAAISAVAGTAFADDAVVKDGYAFDQNKLIPTGVRAEVGVRVGQLHRGVGPGHQPGTDHPDHDERGQDPQGEAHPEAALLPALPGGLRGPGARRTLGVSHKCPRRSAGGAADGGRAAQRAAVEYARPVTVPRIADEHAAVNFVRIPIPGHVIEKAQRAPIKKRAAIIAAVLDNRPHVDLSHCLNPPTWSKVIP